MRHGEELASIVVKALRNSAGLQFESVVNLQKSDVLSRQLLVGGFVGRQAFTKKYRDGYRKLLLARHCIGGYAFMCLDTLHGAMVNI